MKKNNTNFKYLIFLWAILFIIIIPFYAHHGRFFVDCGREAYWPTQILLGKVLYKDIFIVYGPFAYIFNAFLFKIFSIHLNVLYIAGLVSTFFIVSFLFLIAKRFLSPFLSFSIGVFTIVIGVSSLNTFNFIFPYSYAMLYGLVSFLFSIWLLLKYQENPEKISYLYLSSFFAGLCVTSKYEFFPYLIVILYAVFKIKPLKFKEYCFTFISILVVPVLCFEFLFLQGLRLHNLISTALIMKKLSQSPTLIYFYQNSGVYLSKKTIINLIGTSVKSLTSLCIFVFAFSVLKRDLFIIRKFLLVILMVLSIVLMCYQSDILFVFLPILITIIAVLNYKKLLTNDALAILVLGTLSVSLKSYWGVSTMSYGIFIISPLLIAFFALIKDRLKNKINYNAVGIYLLIAGLILFYQNLFWFNRKQNKVETPRGTVHMDSDVYKATADVIKYIEENTKKTDTVVVVPESILLNFLTNRKTDNTYGILTPPILEVFGDSNMIEHFKKTKPEYIIFDALNTSNDYYYRFVCEDYASSFCNYVVRDYTREKIIDDNIFRYIIYKKRL